MPVPWVRMELAMWRMLMVFKCLLLLAFSIKICKERLANRVMAQSTGARLHNQDIGQHWRQEEWFSSIGCIVQPTSSVTFVNISQRQTLVSEEEKRRPPKETHLVVEVVEVAGDKHVDVPHDLQHVQSLRTEEKKKCSSHPRWGNPGCVTAASTGLVPVERDNVYNLCLPSVA